MTRLTDYIYIAITILFTVYGQLIMKWRISQLESLPEGGFLKLKSLISMLFDPYIFSGILAAFLASLAWMVTLGKFELNHAYPFMSLNFVIVILLSGWLLSEPITTHKMLGISLIIAGTIIGAKG